MAGTVSDAVNSPAPALFTVGWTEAKKEIKPIAIHDYLKQQTFETNLTAANQFGTAIGLDKKLTADMTTAETSKTVSGVTGADAHYAPPGTTPNTWSGDGGGLSLFQSVARFGLLILVGAVGLIAFLQMMPKDLGLPAPTPSGIAGAAVKKVLK